jgi:hypothetical protein
MPAVKQLVGRHHARRLALGGFHQLGENFDCARGVLLDSSHHAGSRLVFGVPFLRRGFS